MARGQRLYGDEDKAMVLVALAVNNGNVLRSSRDTGVPQQTVRNWKMESEAGDTKQAVSIMSIEAAGDFAERAASVRDKALQQLDDLIPHADVKDIGKLATIVGIMEDKIRLAMGLATSRTEVAHTLPDPEELRKALAEYTQEAVSAALERDAVIIDAEVVEQPVLGLPASE